MSRGVLAHKRDASEHATQAWNMKALPDELSRVRTALAHGDWISCDPEESRGSYVAGLALGGGSDSGGAGMGALVAGIGVLALAGGAVLYARLNRSGVDQGVADQGTNTAV